MPCPRSYSAAGCTFGHLVDHCGSRRPNKFWSNFQNFHHERAQAAELKTLTVSAFIRDAMISSGCSPEKLEVLLSPAPDVDRPFTPPPRDGVPRIAFLGRLVSHKGIDWRLEAAAQVPTLHIDIAGTGPNDVESDLHALVDDLEIGHRVTFHGWLESEGVNSLISAARAVAVPSTWHEPAGLVTLEAASQGRAVVASAVGGIPEYARPEFAVLAPPRDTDALAIHLRRLASNYDWAAEMGRRGHALMQREFSMDHFLDRLEDVYSRVRSAESLAPLN
jgi:glycosyltransferase involved in cell wall biosynthesis